MTLDVTQRECNMGSHDLLENDLHCARMGKQSLDDCLCSFHCLFDFKLLVHCTSARIHRNEIKPVRLYCL